MVPDPGCWGQNTSRIQNKEVYATLYCQVLGSVPYPGRAGTVNQYLNAYTSNTVLASTAMPSLSYNLQSTSLASTDGWFVTSNEAVTMLATVTFPQGTTTVTLSFKLPTDASGTPRVTDKLWNASVTRVGSSISSQGSSSSPSVAGVVVVGSVATSLALQVTFANVVNQPDGVDDANDELDVAVWFMVAADEGTILHGTRLDLHPATLAVGGTSTMLTAPVGNPPSPSYVQLIVVLPQVGIACSDTASMEDIDASENITTKCTVTNEARTDTYVCSTPFFVLLRVLCCVWIE